MALRIERTEVVPNDSTSTNQVRKENREQTFNYQPSKDDKNMGLTVERQQKKLQEEQHTQHKWVDITTENIKSDNAVLKVVAIATAPIMYPISFLHDLFTK